VAERRGTTVAALITDIDAVRTGGLSSAIRLFVLADLEGRSG
jgi:predicted DNA-binding ribbon-helix-helix protein